MKRVMKLIIPKEQMQKIVEEVGQTIQKDVNIMDETGCIIASTDVARLGTLHVGAVELLEHHLPELIIEKGYQGTQNGINLPLVLDEEVIGVVGITGAVETVRILGVVIKKMTEILILDWYKNSQKQAVEELKRSFVTELLFGDDEKKLELGSAIFSIDITVPRIVSIWEVDVRSHAPDSQQEAFEHIVSKIKKDVEQDKQQLAVRMGMGMKIIMIHSTDNMNRVIKTIEEIKKNIEKPCQCRLYCGVGRSGTAKEGLQKSYKEADAACSLARTKKDAGICPYSETDLSMLMLNIPLEKREAFTNEVFKNCGCNQRKEMYQCLRSYIKNNGSISKISEELYVHKNTLQYRLAKMKTLTGYDPRVLEEAIPLIVALYLHEFQV